MPRISHGSSISLETVRANRAAVRALNDALESPIVLAPPRRLTQFGYLFPDLQADEHLLPFGAQTIENLKRLGASMRDTTPTDDRNARIPAAYTYLGQFIDHDITLEAISDTFLALDDPMVLSAEQVLQRIENQRTASLDLDSLYEPQAQFDGERMRLGTVSVTGKPVPGKDGHTTLVLRPGRGRASGERPAPRPARRDADRRGPDRPGAPQRRFDLQPGAGLEPLSPAGRNTAADEPQLPSHGLPPAGRRT